MYTKPHSMFGKQMMHSMELLNGHGDGKKYISMLLHSLAII